MTQIPGLASKCHSSLKRTRAPWREADFRAGQGKDKRKLKHHDVPERKDGDTQKDAEASLKGCPEDKSETI